MNVQCARLLKQLTADCSKSDDLVFRGQRGKMGTSYWSQLLKGWCTAVGYTGEKVATHSLRKTWVKTQHEKFGASLTTLMYALNHSSERQTLQYVGIVAEDVNKLYTNEI